MTTINESLIRCKAKHLGCFVPFDKPIATYRRIQLLNDTRDEMKRGCLGLCYTSGGVYAGLGKDFQTCLCSSRLEGFISHAKSKRWAESRWNLAENCNASNSYYIYQKSGNCSENVTNYAMEELVEWTHYPFGGKTDRMVSLHSSTVTTNQCILNCERRNYEIAIPHPRKQVCFCSDITSRFTEGDFTNFGSSKPPSTKHLSLPVYRTLVEDPACTVRFGNLTSEGPIALTSDPGSGNTWIRHLLEISTGVYTESVYTDGALYNGGFLGEITEKKMTKPVAVKDHDPQWNSKQNSFKSAILLIRNPHDSLIAEWSRQKSKTHIGLPEASVFVGREFAKHIIGGSNDWKKRNTMALTHKWKLHLLYYENLRENPVREMRRIAEFLQLNSTDHKQNFQRRLMCMQLALTGNFKRPPRKMDFNPFTEELQLAIRDAIKEVNQTLKEHNFQTLPSSYWRKS